MARLSSRAKTNLDQQGFGELDDEAKLRYVLPLRFTPAVGTTLVVIGLVLKSPIWLGLMAIVALSGALLPGGMFIDQVYNLGVRHLFHAPPLPPMPKPRQFSYVASTALLTGSAFSYQFGLPVMGLILGGMVAAGGAILTVTLWCVGSWSYRMILGRARQEQ
jgi:hypothetical protein